jgi:hypothetical protein
MHILQESESSQNIVIIPRSFPGSVTLELIDESTNTTATPSVSVSSANGFMTISGVFSVKNGRYYGLKVFDGSTLIYRDRVFITAQTIFDKYTVNQGVYIEDDSYDNEFVII